MRAKEDQVIVAKERDTKVAESRRFDSFGDGRRSVRHQERKLPARTPAGSHEVTPRLQTCGTNTFPPQDRKSAQSDPVAQMMREKSPRRELRDCPEICPHCPAVKFSHFKPIALAPADSLRKPCGEHPAADHRRWPGTTVTTQTNAGAVRSQVP
jgi:hypothetical protein